MMLDTRPSKKQQELFSFIEAFIKSNGYGPSYREIMRALDYKSVSTVAVHVDGLITRGMLQKKDNSARSLEVVSDEAVVASSPNEHHAWLEREIKKRQNDDTAQKEVEVLESALNILKGSAN
jgi:repressor LexA